jgi:ABC-type Fe3+ transport system permease subunit
VAGNVLAAVILILAGVAWLRYSDRLDGAAARFAAKTGLQSDERPPRERPQSYRAWHVWGGGILLIGLGLAFLVASVFGRG